MSQTIESTHLIELRRDLHQYPEPAWCEFYTTCRIVEEIQRIDVDELFIGPEAIDADHRLGVPETTVLDDWYTRAKAAGANEDILPQLRDGHTGIVAILDRGTGPTVGLRVDLDALLREESKDASHLPVQEGFRASYDDAMHACGHDAHATIGVGVLETIAKSDFSGTLKVFFQPAEEEIGGGRAIVESGHLDDVEYLFCLHVGLGHPTGEVVAGIDDFLAVKHIYATFSGRAAHAGASPETGRNAVQAVATSIQNLYAIPRHADGATRINVGRVGGGTATNIIPEHCFIDIEVRGGTTPLRDYMFDRAVEIIEAAAKMHGCTVEMTIEGEAPSATSDQELVDIITHVSKDVDSVDSIVERGPLGGSEDATFLIRKVQRNGGLATYVGIGTDHPGGHHTSTFDVDETSIPIGVAVLSSAILKVSEEFS